MPADDYVNAGAARNFLVFAHREVRQRDHCLNSATVNLRNHLPRRFAGIEKLNIGAGPRCNFCFLQRQPKYSYLHAVKLANHISGRIAERLARLFVNHVRHDPLEFGFLHSLSQHVGTKVELMVAKG